ncbi:uncharacterized protein LOC102703896 [Oryza brachyantha]|uniref:uncharacterized protein LOC102703896 n=1 Tax=Oryza brachyantha TaxID=4533 RepID=UPI000776421D|nr:uncharacterized protein LOC102703896 [Oryza brachyantha]
MAKMLVDGGAAVNLMPYSTYRKLGKTPKDLIKTNMMLKDFGGNSSKAKGCLNVELTVGSKTLPTTFFVIDDKESYSLLLGFTPTAASRQPCIKARYSGMETKWRWSQQIEWVSNIVPVLKNNGKLRVCVDFRDLNKATPKDEYPIPVADQLVDAASGHKMISFMDGNAGYIQIFVADEDIHKKAFRCPGAISLFEWVAKYEALVKGLELLKEIGVEAIEVMGDSQLVIKQLSREYECRDDILRTYYEIAKELLEDFKQVTLTHIPREQNAEANCLAQRASGYRLMSSETEVEIAQLEQTEEANIACAKANDWRHEIIDYLKEPSSSANRKIKYKALKYVLLEDLLYYRTIDGVLLRCLAKEEAKVVMCEVHDGICGTHQSAYKMKWLLRRVGYYWPTMLEDCFMYYKSCQDYQKFGNIQRSLASAMNPIIKPWPFRGWGIDMIRQIYPQSSKGHKFLLAAIDYFTKSVKAIPLKRVTSADVINFMKEHIIHRFGIPHTITTNHGSVFISEEFQQFIVDMGIKLLNSSPYYAQANGQQRYQARV